MLAKTQTVGASASRTLATSYLPNGQVEGHVLPSGAVVRYSYRADGRTLSISVNGVEIVREVDYHAFGEPKSWRYGNTDSYQRVFDRDGRIEQHSAGANVRTLGYDEASRIKTQTDSAGGPNQWTYDYDDLDRLETASNAGTQGAIANLAMGWDYDPTGNRTQETRGAAPPVPFVIAPASNRLDSVGGQSRNYDTAGNTINDGTGTTSVYNARNRLIRTTKAGLTTHYAHNAFGERVCKASAGPDCLQSADRIEYVYDDDGHLVGEYAPNLTDHTETLWLGDTPIAILKRRPGSSDAGPGGGGTPTAWSGTPAGGVDIYLIHPDHLDTPRVVVNASNAPVWRWDSAPFGDTAANENPTAGIPSFTYNLRFPGQQYDRETGTHYNYFRDYEAQTGRYVQSDPVGLDGGAATYSYMDSSPLWDYDVDGLWGRRGRPTTQANYRAGKGFEKRFEDYLQKTKCKGCTVRSQRYFRTSRGGRYLDFVVYDAHGKPMAGYECKQGNAKSNPTPQRRRDSKDARLSSKTGAREVMTESSASALFSRTVSEVGRALGYGRRGNNLVKDYGDTYSVIMFQRDKHNTSTQITFWCNVGGGSRLLHESFPSIREPYQMVFDQCPFRVMTDLYCNPGKWTITPSTDPKAMAQVVSECLTSKLGWFLGGFSDDGNIKKLLLESEYHIVPDRFRRAYLEIYANRGI